MFTARQWGALVAFFGVALGAFGAHGLQSILTENGTTEIWKTATLYHLVHGVAMFVPLKKTGRIHPALFFGLGVLFFSGSLYLLAVTGISKLGMVTPIGGVFFLVGWVMAFLSGKN